MAPVFVSPFNVGHIDDVQELRKSKPTSIPQRLIRDIAEEPSLSTLTPPSPSSKPSFTAIPVVEFIKTHPKHQTFKARYCLSGLGILSGVINHGIDLGFLERPEKVSMDFFMMPLEEKQKYPMAPGTIQGYGQAFVFSEDQKLDWCNMFALGVEPHSIRNPKLWPTKPTKLSEELYEIDVPLKFEAPVGARIYGLACWFDVLFDGSTVQRWLSTAPGAPPTHWYQLRCVLSQPLYVMSGQEITGRLHMIAHNAQSYSVNLTMI
ncbi:unnamed protein product [Camellia sinensis]